MKTDIEQEFLDYCIKKGKGNLPIAVELLELITEFINIDREKQLSINNVMQAQPEKVCDHRDEDWVEDEGGDWYCTICDEQA